jgi:hypothetical protein
MTTIKNIATATLVAVYNKLAEEPVTEFKNRTQAEKRTAAIMAEYGWTVDQVEELLAAELPTAEQLAPSSEELPEVDVSADVEEPAALISTSPEDRVQTEEMRAADEAAFPEMPAFLRRVDGTSSLPVASAPEPREEEPAKPAFIIQTDMTKGIYAHPVFWDGKAVIQSTRKGDVAIYSSREEAEAALAAIPAKIATLHGFKVVDQNDAEEEQHAAHVAAYIAAIRERSEGKNRVGGHALAQLREPAKAKADKPKAEPKRKYRPDSLMIGGKGAKLVDLLLRPEGAKADDFSTTALATVRMYCWDGGYRMDKAEDGTYRAVFVGRLALRDSDAEVAAYYAKWKHVLDAEAYKARFGHEMPVAPVAEEQSGAEEEQTEAPAETPAQEEEQQAAA